MLKVSQGGKPDCTIQGMKMLRAMVRMFYKTWENDEGTEQDLD